MRSLLFLFLIVLQEFSDARDADDARYNLDGRDFDGSRMIVEFAKGVIFIYLSMCNISLFMYVYYFFLSLLPMVFIVILGSTWPRRIP
jgi:hypothetical protein